MTQPLKDRVALILKDQQIKPIALAGVAGVSKGLVSQWMNGERQEMGFEAAERIHRKYAYAIKWLINGIGNKMASDQDQALVRGADISDLGLEIGRSFDRLSDECKEHIQRQIELLHMADAHNGRRAAQHDLEIKGGKLQSVGKSGKRSAR